MHCKEPENEAGNGKRSYRHSRRTSLSCQYILSYEILAEMYAFPLTFRFSFLRMNTFDLSNSLHSYCIRGFAKCRSFHFVLDLHRADEKIHLLVCSIFPFPYKKHHLTSIITSIIHFSKLLNPISTQQLIIFIINSVHFQIPRNPVCTIIQLQKLPNIKMIISLFFALPIKHISRSCRSLC